MSNPEQSQTLFSAEARSQLYIALRALLPFVNVTLNIEEIAAGRVEFLSTEARFRSVYTDPIDIRGTDEEFTLRANAIIQLLIIEIRRTLHDRLQSIRDVRRPYRGSGRQGKRRRKRD